MTDQAPRPGLVVERGTAASWRTYRDVRLAALIYSPRAFWAQYAEAAERTDEEWRERCATTGATTGATWLAFDDGRPVGTVGLWHAEEQPAHEVYLVGMWVATVARGTDVATRLVATRLVAAALTSAAASGWRRVVLDVAHENARWGLLHAAGVPGHRGGRHHALGPLGHRGDPGARPARRLLKFTPLRLLSPAVVVGEWPP